jgi:hypothetical protein
MANSNPHIDTIRRAALPELLFAPDLSLATGCNRSAMHTPGAC